MSSTTAKSAFTSGAAASVPFLIVVLPFAMLFGVVATEAGLDISQTMGFSVIVVAGASQFTAVQLLSDGAPVAVVLAAALAVNLRMAMYSAALVPHLATAPLGLRALVAYLLVDQTYALSELEYSRRPEWSVRDRLAFFFGAALAIVPPWYVVSYAGARLGASVFAGWPLDFALPIAFLAMTAPMLKTAAHGAAALVSALGVLVFAGLPSGLGLIVAGLLAMAAGAAVETLREGRR